MKTEEFQSKMDYTSYMSDPEYIKRIQEKRKQKIDEIKEKTKRFLKILEPVSIIFIAFFIGLIVISVLLPIFRLGENLNI